MQTIDRARGYDAMLIETRGNHTGPDEQASRQKIDKLPLWPGRILG
jgi:hypothetical protein